MTVMLAVIIVAAIFLAVIAAASSKKKTGAKTEYKYTRKTPLTEVEQKMYWKLVTGLPNHVVLAQVELSRCIDAKGGVGAHNTISGKSLDFVICNKALEIVAGIEIDDKSHSRPDRQKSDATKNSAMEKAGIKLIRWPATELPSSSQILETFPTAEIFTPEQTTLQNRQEGKIKILEEQLFDMARKLEQARSRQNTVANS